MAQDTTETARLLVISRDSALLGPLWSIADANSWQIETALSAWDAIERVQSDAPDLLILDLPRGGNESLHLLRWIRRFQTDVPIIVTCSPEDANLAKDAEKFGAQEVLSKPFDEARLQSMIRQLIGSDRAENEISSEHVEEVGPDSFFVFASPVTQKLRAQAELLAEADVPTLILGEKGTGKETLARLIHKLSVRSGFPFFKVNCAGMPGALLEAELFGSQSGLGKIERAQKGTIFIDEIAEMPAHVQERLMQILQERVFPKAANGKSASVDVRIIAATSDALDRALIQNRLREDLYYRLSAFTLQVPPLRHRSREIPVLLRHSMYRMAKHYGLPSREFPFEVLSQCQQYSWPGNLRELDSFVKRCLVSGDANLAFSALGTEQSDAEPVANVSSSPRPAVNSTFGNGSTNHGDSKSLKSLVQNVKSEAERTAIGNALQKTGWNRKAAARLLQVGYRTLLYKIDQYHMSASEPFVSPMPPNSFPFQAANKGNGKS